MRDEYINFINKLIHNFKSKTVDAETFRDFIHENREFINYSDYAFAAPLAILIGYPRPERIAKWDLQIEKVLALINHQDFNINEEYFGDDTPLELVVNTRNSDLIGAFMQRYKAEQSENHETGNHQSALRSEFALFYKQREVSGTNDEGCLTPSFSQS